MVDVKYMSFTPLPCSTMNAMRTLKEQILCKHQHLEAGIKLHPSSFSLLWTNRRVSRATSIEPVKVIHTWISGSHGDWCWCQV